MCIGQRVVQMASHDRASIPSTRCLKARADGVLGELHGELLALCTTTMKRTRQLACAAPCWALALWAYADVCRVYVVDFNTVSEYKAVKQVLWEVAREAVASTLGSSPSLHCAQHATTSQQLVQYRHHNAEVHSVIEYMDDEAKASGLFTVFHTDAVPHWHASLCKNVAHLGPLMLDAPLAAAHERGRAWLMNHDGHRVVGHLFVPTILEHVRAGPNTAKAGAKTTIIRFRVHRAPDHRDSWQFLDCLCTDSPTGSLVQL